TITVAGNLVGDTTNASDFNPLGKVQLNSTISSTSSPQQLEVMGRDGGGVTSNFAYGTLEISTADVPLVDRADKGRGTGREALYVDTLIVDPGETLDLHGFNVYTNTLVNNGTITDTTTSPTPPGTVVARTVQVRGTIKAPATLVNDSTPPTVTM